MENCKNLVELWRGFSKGSCHSDDKEWETKQACATSLARAIEADQPKPQKCTEAFRCARREIHETARGAACDYIVEISPEQLADKGYYKANNSGN